MEHEEFKWITVSKAGRCQACGQEIVLGQRALWSLTNKQNIWCKSCGEINSVDQNPVPQTSGDTEKGRDKKVSRILLVYDDGTSQVFGGGAWL